MTMTVYTEFGKLEECVVGTSYTNCNINGLDRIIDETNEDLDMLADMLSKAGVFVHRPSKPKFDINTHHPIMPRDVFGFFGDKIFRTYGAIKSRINEIQLYHDISMKYVSKSSKIYHMPIPKLLDCEDTEIVEQHTNKIKFQQRYDLYKDKFLWETANMIKCGDTIIHTQSALKDPINGKGTEAGLQWIKHNLKEFKFIELPVGGHIDGKLALLRPGLLMTWREDYIPQQLKSWDKIIIKDNAILPEEFKKTKKQRFYSDYVIKYLSDWVGYSEETWFDVNCFSLDENTIITTGKDIQNIKQIEKYGINVVKWNHRHRYFWDGGAHCCTQDTKRNDKKESYV